LGHGSICGAGTGAKGSGTGSGLVLGAVFGVEGTGFVVGFGKAITSDIGNNLLKIKHF
jgi:hypothetical protein